MKGAVLALFCAAALVSAELNENGCPINPYVDILKPHPICNKYYQCVQGDLVERKCASDLSFNVEIQECDWAANVDCGNRPVTPESREESGNDSNTEGDSSESGNDSNSNGDISSEENGNNSSSNESGNDSENNNNGNGNGNPNEAAEICAREGSNGVLVAHEDCNKLYKCSYGVPVALDCYTGLLYNIEKEECDWPENVDCKGRNQGGNGDASEEDGGNDNNNNGENSSNEDTGNNSSSNESGNDSGNNNNGNGNGNPEQARDICAAEDSDGVLVAHENCNQFYKCSDGVPVALDCNSGLLYNYNTEQCDWPENVDCKGRNQGGTGDASKEDGGNENNNNGGNSSNEDSGNKSSSNESGNDSGSNNNGNGNGNPEQARDICAAEDSDGVLVAHENCNQFYKCSDGVPVALDCNSGLLYNYNTEQCDWPENVDCKGRNQGGIGDASKEDGGNENNNNGGNNSNEDSGNKSSSKESGNDSGSNNNGNGNGNPEQARDICAAEDSDGVLVAHENCNQFYKCSDGVPVALNCNSGLLYNYNTEQCDWPDNVDCKGRDQGGDDNGNDNNGGNGDADKDEEADKEDGENNNNGGGNSDPSHAHDICAREDSDSVLVAHENCNQYYICKDGLPVTLNCNPNLVFNPATDQCEWPEKVDCGTRRTFTSLNKHIMRWVK